VYKEQSWAVFRFPDNSSRTAKREATPLFSFTKLHEHSFAQKHRVFTLKRTVRRALWKTSDETCPGYPLNA